MAWGEELSRAELSGMKLCGPLGRAAVVPGAALAARSAMPRVFTPLHDPQRLGFVALTPWCSNPWLLWCSWALLSGQLCFCLQTPIPASCSACAPSGSRRLGSPAVPSLSWAWRCFSMLQMSLLSWGGMLRHALGWLPQPRCALGCPGPMGGLPGSKRRG